MASLCGTAFCKLKFLMDSVSAASLEYCVPAANMRDRVIGFRREFINRYLIPRADFPILENLASAQILPVDVTDSKRLAARGVVKVQNVSGNPHARKLVNNTGSALWPRFVSYIQNQTIGVRVSIPKPLRIRAEFDETRLDFTIESKLILILEDRIMQNGIPLPIFEEQVLERLTLSDDAMTYHFAENGDSTNKFRLKLDLTGQCQNNPGMLGLLVNSAARRFAKMLLFLLICTPFFAGCIKNHGGAVNPCVNRECIHQDSLPVISRPCNTATNGVLELNGIVYFQVGRDVPNEFCTFVPASDEKESCSLVICSTVIPPQGWLELTVEHSDKYCTYPTSPLRNVKVVQKCFNISIGPISLPAATRGAPYNQVISATANVAPACQLNFRYERVSGNLPAGLQMSGNTISGTPTTIQTTNFRVRATNVRSNDVSGCFQEIDYSITVQ